jgi:hypothetical protein
MPEARSQDHAFGGGASDSVLNPIVLSGLLLAVLLTLLLPRKYAIIPVLLITFLVPAGQQIYLAGMHWTALRVIIVAGFVRVACSRFSSKSQVFGGGFNLIDQAFLCCTLCQAAGTVLQYMQTPALINQFGFLIDELGGYFLLRYLIQDRHDIYRALKCLAFLSVILAGFMIREQLTLRNAFGTLGGVQLVPDVREGKVRSQGVFQHALMAGSFAATLLPLFFLLWKSGKARLIAVLGVMGCTIMTITSQSSTPLLAYIAGVLAVLLWPIRKHMKKLRWGLVIALLGLAMVMKAPVWFLIAHIDLTGGSSGYHRAELIDQFIRHFSDWWLIGTTNAGTWGYDLWDTQNQYVNVGESGGLAAFVFFIVMICRCYQRIGNARRSAAGKSGPEWFVWLLGAALFAHLVAFFGVNYFDQSKMGWFLLLAMICSVIPMQRKRDSRKIEENLNADLGSGETGELSAIEIQVC